MAHVWVSQWRKLVYDVTTLLGEKVLSLDSLKLTFLLIANTKEESEREKVGEEILSILDGITEEEYQAAIMKYPQHLTKQQLEDY